MKDLTIAYIGGGSRNWAWTLMSDLANEKELTGTVRLYDIDFEAAKVNETIGNRLKERADLKGKWTYKAAKTLGEALEGCDVVVASILPGTFQEMKSDVHAPEKYGIYQSVGDTTGPGGILRALRAIPMYAEIAKAVQKYAPDAWVINYTNPMALCVRTLHEVYPGIKAFGCCHEVFGTQKLLAQALADVRGIKGVKRDQIRINVLGVNHFTWIDRASYRDIDLFPVWREFADKHFEKGWDKSEDHKWLHPNFLSSERVKFDLFRRYGLIAAAGDRHLAEFLPPWYLADPATVESWKFRLSPVDWRIQNAAGLREKAAGMANGTVPFAAEPSEEEGVKLIKAISGLGDLVTNVNLPNRGQVQGLPLGAVVETNAVFSRDSVQPVMAGRLPAHIESLVSRPAQMQAIVLKAALEKDYQLALSAFVQDPLVRIRREDAEILFKDMLKATKKYLKGWKI